MPSLLQAELPEDAGHGLRQRAVRAVLADTVRHAGLLDRTAVAPAAVSPIDRTDARGSRASHTILCV